MEFLKEAIAVAGVYLWFALLAIIGGSANYIGTLKANKEKTFSWVELLAEWLVSGFSGLITAYICVAQGVNFELTCAAAGVAGHMGGRSVYLLEQFFISKLPKNDRG